MKNAKTISNVRVGKPDVDPTMPSHVAGIREGNEKGSQRKMRGFERKDGKLRGTARRSTGICADDREPIDPRMPNLSPS